MERGPNGHLEPRSTAGEAVRVFLSAPAVETAHRLLALFRRDQLRVEGLGRAAANTLRVFHALRMRPLASIGDLSTRTGLAFPTVSRAVEALETLGILREITGRARDRVYAYDAYISILNEGAEPL